MVNTSNMKNRDKKNILNFDRKVLFQIIRLANNTVISIPTSNHHNLMQETVTTNNAIIKVNTVINNFHILIEPLLNLFDR